MPDSKAPQRARNKPLLKHTNEKLMTMNALSQKTTRKTKSEISTSTLKAKNVTLKSTSWNKKKPAPHTKTKVAAAQSTSLLYTCQINYRKAATTGATRNSAYFKPNKVIG
jgi:hypothetical protein